MCEKGLWYTTFYWIAVLCSLVLITIFHADCTKIKFVRSNFADIQFKFEKCRIIYQVSCTSGITVTPVLQDSKGALWLYRLCAISRWQQTWVELVGGSLVMGSMTVEVNDVCDTMVTNTGVNILWERVTIKTPPNLPNNKHKYWSGSATYCDKKKTSVEVLFIDLIWKI